MDTDNPTADVPADVEELVRDLPHAAAEHTPAPYPDAEIQARGGQDDLDELGGPGDAPHTAAEAIKLAREWVAEELFLGVGFCLKVIRSLYGVMPLYPDAETAWEQAERKHHTDDPDAIPWGVPVWWVNDRHGHVALSLGKGRCLTTDFVEPGHLGVAPIARLASWCGGRLVGWTNDVNGVDVWEPRKPRPEPWTLEDRARFVRAALERAIAHDAERRVRGLRRWLRAIEARIDRHG